jgi:hypothetical protein
VTNGSLQNPDLLIKSKHTENYYSIFSWKGFVKLNYIFENGFAVRSGVGLRKLMFKRSLEIENVETNILSNAVRRSIIDYPKNGVSIYYIDVPILLGYNYESNDLAISAGVIASFMQSSEQGKNIFHYNTEPNDYVITYSKNEGINKIAYSLNAELVYRLKKHIEINFTASRFLTSIYSSNYVISTKPVLNSIEVGFCFTFY